MSANPSWYDLLDVDSTASADEIRTAWKSAIAELDPTDRRFRVLNQAAEVLLDPEGRAEYDAARLAERSEAEPTVVEEVAQQPSRDQVTDAPAEPTSVEQEGTSPGLVTGAGAPSSTTAGRLAGSAGVALLAILGLLAAALVAACIWKAQEPTDDQVTDATADALAASGPAVEALLSYDYRDLDGTRKAVDAVTTDEYRKKSYDPFFEGVIEPNAGNTKTIVQAEVVEAGIVRSGDDRVQVFVLVNRPTTNADTKEPVVYRDSATVTMEKVGDDWLIDALDTDILD